MDKTTAIRLVRKLRAVTEDRGATGPEAQLAAEKASRLEKRFGLGPMDFAAPKVKPREWRASPMGGVVPFFDFDIATGKAGPGVKVHHYTNRSNWKVEIPF